MISNNSSTRLLSRYSTKRGSALTLTKRSNSSTALQKIAYHTSRLSTLKPIAEFSSSEESSRGSEDPDDEAGIPKNLMTVQQHRNKHHHDIQINDLPPLPFSITPQNESLIIGKLEICSTMCDFTDLEADRQAKNVKLQTLKELQNVFNSPVNIGKLSDNVMKQFFEMLKTNIGRDIPNMPKQWLVFDDEPPMMDIAWNHLMVVYQLLLKYQELEPKSKYFDDAFINLMLSVIHAPDINERDNVAAFFINYLNTFPNLEKNILDHLSYDLIGYKDKVYPPFCVIPCLRIFLVRFKLHKDSYEKNHLQYFKKAILPLLTCQHIFSYYPQLLEILDYFLTINNKLVLEIFDKVLQGFPNAKASKQILYIRILNFLAEKVDMDDFDKIAIKLFKLYSICSMSSHYKVVDASFQIWGNIHIIPKIIDNTKAIYPIVFNNYNKTMKEHWSNRAQNAALNTLKSMHDNDPFMFDELSQSQQKKNSLNQSVPDPEAVKIHKSWAMVAREAAKVDKSINLARILADIQVRFSSKNNDEMAKKQRPPTKPLVTPPSQPKIVAPGLSTKRF